MSVQGGDNIEVVGNNQGPPRGPPPPPPIDARIIMSDASSKSSLRRSSRLRERRDSSRSSAAPSMSGAETASVVSDDFGTQDRGLEAVLRPIAAGAAMGLSKPGQYSEKERKKMKKQLKEQVRRDAMQQALNEERRHLREKFRIRRVLDNEELDPALEQAPPASSEALKEVKIENTKYARQLLSNNLHGLSDVLNNFISSVNSARINFKQAAGILSGFFTGTMAENARILVKRHPLPEVLDIIRRQYCQEETPHECQVKVSKWKLGKGSKKKIERSLLDLYMMVTKANPDASVSEALEMTKVLVKSQMPEGALHDLSLSEEMEVLTTGRRLGLHAFTDEVLKAMDKYPRPVVESDVFQVQQCHQETREPERSTSDRAMAMLIGAVEKQTAMVGKMIENIAQMQQNQNQHPPLMASQFAPAPYQQPHRQQPMTNYPPPRGNYNPPMAMPQQTQGRMPWRGGAPQGSGGFSGTRSSLTYLYPHQAEYQRAASFFKKEDLGPRLPQKGPGEVFVRYYQDKTVEPVNQDVQPFPRSRAVFAHDPRTDKYLLTGAVKAHFGGRRCTSCGLLGHSPASPGCPFYDVPESWELCETCRLGFHTRCKYAPGFLSRFQPGN